jgi:hypothetical protein
MSSELLKAIKALEQFATATTRQEYFQKLREPDKSEVFDNFLSIMSSEDPTINKTTGVRHTVESMVSELSNRVGLDAVLQKNSADAVQELSRKAKYMVDDGKIPNDTEIRDILSEFSRKYFLERDHGLSSVETMIEEFKYQPHGMKIIETFGRDKIRDILRDIVNQYPKDDPMASLPSGGAIVMPAADQQSSSTSERANVGIGGSPGVSNR